MNALADRTNAQWSPLYEPVKFLMADSTSELII